MKEMILECLNVGMISTVTASNNGCRTRICAPFVKLQPWQHELTSTILQASFFFKNRQRGLLWFGACLYWFS